MWWWMLSAHAATLELEVSGLRDTGGQVVAALFDDEEGFPTKGDLARTTMVVAAGEVVRFEGLPPGRYAVSLFHDANQNGRLDMWWFGPPKEGVASSNDASGRMGPPSFAEASIEVGPADVKQVVTMSYLFGR
jgi:uncharacterized protein (DUF2141 family)